MKIQQPSLPYGPARPTVHCPFYRSTVARDTAVRATHEDEHTKTEYDPRAAYRLQHNPQSVHASWS